MNQRDLNMSEYEISRFAYRELKYFCLQYEEKKKRAAGLSQLSATVYDGMPHGGAIGNPTEQKAIVAAQLHTDCELIEQTAMEAANGWGYQQLIKNVTLGVPYSYLDIPCGKNKFTDIRRRFFYLLAKKKGMV